MITAKSKDLLETRHHINVRNGILSFHFSGNHSRTPCPTVFLDRDGVLNRRIPGGYVTRWEEFAFLPGVMESLAKLGDAGFQLVIISNQAGVAKGILTCADLIQITEMSLDELQAHGVRVEGAFFCLHSSSDACSCRKPKVGLFQEAARLLPVNFRRSFFIGDSPSDMHAGAEMGCATIYLGGAGEFTSADYHAANMNDAVGWVLTRNS
jgi:D-glycero-D-manno-heptose 1,7-bisphosphate phosphatase